MPKRISISTARMCCLCRNGNRPISSRPVCESCYFETDEQGRKTKPNFSPRKKKSYHVESFVYRGELCM